MPINRYDLALIRELFHGLIRARACEGGLRIPEDLPHLNELQLDAEPSWYPVPGMHGGFRYCLKKGEGDLELHVESWSRLVDGSGMRHVITPTQVILMDAGFV